MRFSAPAYLVLLGVAFWMWRARHGRATRAALLRTSAAVLLVLGIAGLQIRGGASPLSVMFVVDRSASMSGDGTSDAGAVADLARDMRPGDTAGVVVFGADAAVERRPAAGIAGGPIASRVNETGTNIAAGLRLGAAALERAAAGRIVLVTDGHETSGRALDEAARLAAARIPVDVVAPGSRQPRALSIVRLTAPASVRAREPFVLTATVSGPPGRRGEIVVTPDGGEPQRLDVTVPADGIAAVSLRGLHERAGVYTYRAAAAADDFGGDAGEAGAVVTVTGEPVLLHAGARDGAAVQALAGGPFRVARVPAAGLPRAPAELAQYDGVVLNDIDPDSVDPAQAAALAEYVEGLAGGLLVLGSPRSLHAGLDAGSPLGRLLPIDLRPRGGRRAPGLALVVVFDKSGSMDDRVGGIPRIEFARQAIGRAVDALAASDALGVIAFDASAVAVVPLAAGRSAADLAPRVREIEPGGATAIAPAIDLARQWLGGAAADPGRRHLLLVSDGRTSATDAARARELADRGGFQLTAVALGGGADRRFLASLAERTGGRAYFPENIRELPAILAREAARVSGGGIVQETFRPRAASHALLAGLDTSAMPRLGGYAAAALKPAAAAAIESHLNDPILATWRAGLGKVAVYTADVDSPWSAELRAWPGFAPLMRQTARWLGRSAAGEDLYARLAHTDRGITLIVEAPSPDGSSRTPLECRATARAPGGSTLAVALRERRPGRCEADVPASAPGPYTFAIDVSSPGGTFAASIVRGTYWTATREREDAPADTPLLQTLAAVTGGRMLAAGDTAFSAARPAAYVELRRWLAAAALLLVLAELFAPAALAALRAIRSRSEPDFPDTPAGRYTEAA